MLRGPFNFFSRHVSSSMRPSLKAPKEPLVVIFGSTGTGKSELAVEVATRFRGEVINADAMQLYRGLPVITNKITEAQQRGIPHHLLDRIPLCDVPWDVIEFRKHALETIREIRSRGNLPILVGGTHYYLEPLLFADAVLDGVQYDRAKSFPILSASTEEMLAELRRVDPEIADRWHPNDRRKIKRSLEIYLNAGKTASSLYAEQQQRKLGAAAVDDAQATPWENLLFWVFSEKDVLNSRLDGRVDSMLSNGLVDEVQELYTFKQNYEMGESKINTTKGIWQSIGYKHLEPYIAAMSRNQNPEEVEKLKATGLESMKTATRRYANQQYKWIRTKQIPKLMQRGREAMDSLYVLDSTNAASYRETVVAPAIELVSQFLQGQPRPSPLLLSTLAESVLKSVTQPRVKQVFVQRTCDICQITVVTDMLWDQHMKSATHRRMLNKKKRLALVPLEQPDPETDSENSDLGIESLLEAHQSTD